MLQICRRAQFCYRASSLQFHRFQSAPPGPVIEKEKNFRKRAEFDCNPYKSQFLSNAKPRTYRERFIEKIRNKPKPRIGDGTSSKSQTLLKRASTTNRSTFYGSSNYRKKTFLDLGLDERIVQQIAELGVFYPTSHQSEVIPVLRQGKNCLYVSPTGSGKTYTFLLPVVQSILEQDEEGYITRAGAPRAIIMTPTKELAIQIGQVTKHLVQDLPVSVLSLSDHNKLGQAHSLLSRRPFEILVGTSSRISTLLSDGSLSSSDLSHLVIDEVEEFFDYRNIEENRGFLRELVIDEGGVTKFQVIMAGATLTRWGFARAAESIPQLQQYLSPKAHAPLAHVQQRFFFVNKINKTDHFLRFIKDHLADRSQAYQRPLIFCNFNNVAYALHKELIRNNIDNLLLQGDLSAAKKRYLLKYGIPDTSYPVIVSEGFACGIDFRDFGMVVNYEFPLTYDGYLRRMGRTGRLSTVCQSPEVVSYVSLVKDKALYATVVESSEDRRCTAYTMAAPGPFGWLKG